MSDDPEATNGRTLTARDIPPYMVLGLARDMCDAERYDEDSPIGRHARKVIAEYETLFDTIHPTGGHGMYLNKIRSIANSLAVDRLREHIIMQETLDNAKRENDFEIDLITDEESGLGKLKVAGKFILIAGIVGSLAYATIGVKFDMEQAKDPNAFGLLIGLAIVLVGMEIGKWFKRRKLRSLRDTYTALRERIRDQKDTRIEELNMEAVQEAEEAWGLFIDDPLPARRTQLPPPKDPEP